MQLTRRQSVVARWGALKNERTSWIGRYQDITRYILPFAGRYFVQDRNRGTKNWNDIYDSTAGEALDILAAGMMAGMTSPARPWFRLAVADPDLMESERVKVWLNEVGELMRAIFAKSNTYRALHSMYEELGAFSTAANIVEDNFDTILWNHPLTAGEYAIGTDHLGRVNTLYREFEMTVEQIVRQFVYDDMADTFDWSKVSPQIKTLWDTGKGYDQWRPVIHAIEPRTVAMQVRGDEFLARLPRNMPWASTYLESGINDDHLVLRESGYQDFPVLAPRWHTRGRDIYGHGPGMKALGDIKQLQHEQLRKAQAIDYQTLPPIGVPAGTKGSDVQYLPGGVTPLGAGGAGAAKSMSLFDVKLDLQALLGDILDVRQRIQKRFYADLFLMISNDQRRMPVTAREIAERHEEKLLMLGPVLERLHDEMLSPLIETTFTKIVKAGLLRGALTPPPEMQGLELKVEFVSTLAQAQKAIGLATFDRLLGTVALIGQGKGDLSVWDKVDTDEVIDKYADMLSVDPSVIVADEKVALIRQQRAEQQAAAQAAAAAPAMAAAAKDATQADPAQVRDVMSGLMGYGGAV